MSNQKKSKAPHIEVLDAAIGQRTAGGCLDCLAYQTVDRDEHGTYHIRIHHDGWCPYLNGVTRSSQERGHQRG